MRINAVVIWQTATGKNLRDTGLQPIQPDQQFWEVVPKNVCFANEGIIVSEYQNTFS